MSPTRARILQAVAAVLAVATLLSPLSAWAQVGSAAAAKAKHHRTVMRQALQSAVTLERRAIDQLSKAVTVNQVHQGAGTAHAGYAEMRRAADRLGTVIDIYEKYPDPMLKIHDKQLEEARYITRLGLAEVEGAPRYDAARVQKAIGYFRRAISIVDIILASMV